LDGTSYTTLAEVLAVGKVIAPKILKLISGLAPSIS